MTDKERVEKFKSGKIAINCSTEEEAIEFVKWCHDNNIEWLNSTKNGAEYDIYLTDTCYMYHPFYSSLWITSKRNFEKCKNKIITYKEFMKADKNRVTNLEKYYDELISSYKSPNCYWLEVIKKGNRHEMSCKKCGMDFVHWLNEEYKENKEPIKLTQFEYDMLLITKVCHSNLGKLEENLYYINLQDKGHFKNVDLSKTAKEVLENCEVVENVD